MQRLISASSCPFTLTPPLLPSVTFCPTPHLHFQIIAAFILDILIGDPQWRYHPVRLIGKFIECFEHVLRRLPLPERPAGMLLTTVITGAVWLSASVIMSITSQWCCMFETITGAIIIYFSISIKSLADEAKKVMHFLRKNDLINARKALSQIVGRDTEHLNKEQIIRACVETVAESAVDGALSPLFFSFIGGPGAAMAYRAVNTMDSMVGHKDEKYLRFGWASARLDDIANYLPARISAVLIPVAAFLCGYSLVGSLRIAFRDGQKHESPNSGIPEAAMAGALGVQVGGTISYQGEIVVKPFIGDAHNPLTVNTVDGAVKIMFVTASLFLAGGIGAVMTLKRLLLAS